MHKPTHIMIHHSLTEDSSTLSWGIIRKNHKLLGWDNIGYHYGVEFVRGSYEILIGRFVGEEGAHCPQEGMNRKAIGICLIGDFDVIKPSQEQLAVARKLVRQLMQVWDIPRENVVAHRDYNHTKTCPGKQFDMDAFRELL